MTTLHAVRRALLSFPAQPSEIDLARARPGESDDFSAASHRDNLSVPHGNGFNDGEIFVSGEHLAVVQDLIRVADH